MAQKVNIVLIDDLDGTEGAETIQFGLDGVAYEIELAPHNADRLRTTLAEFVGGSRRVGGRRRGAGAVAGGTSAKEIRAWARDNGHDVPERGRIPADVRAAFESR